MLKELLTVSMVSMSVTEVVAMTVEHGLFGKLDVIDHKDDIKAYNSWCKSQNQSVDDTDFLATSCAGKCFKFDNENSPNHFSRGEAEDLLKSVSKNPVAASMMKVLISKYNKYDENTLAKCGLTKDENKKIAYSYYDEWYEPCIKNHDINLKADLTGDKQLMGRFINYQDPKRYASPSLKRQLTHEMMHFMDFIIMFDTHKVRGRSEIGLEKSMNFLDSQTIRGNCIDSVSKITKAENSLTDKEFCLKDAIHWVYDESVESQGMFGMQLVQYSKKYNLSNGTEQCSYKFAYEPINDAFSHLYGFDEKDEFVGQIRLNHKDDERLLPAAQILEDNFHIYSFYKQQDVQKAFEFSTKVVEEA